MIERAGERIRVSAKGLICSGLRPHPATTCIGNRQFVDADDLVYAHDTSAGEKHVLAKALVQDLWAHRSGVLSTQVLQELVVNLRRKARHPLDANAVRDIVSDYLTWRVVVNTGDSILGALEIEARH